MNIQGMIISVGNTPEPVIYSLQGKQGQGTPSNILFIVSEGSEHSVGSEIICSLDYTPQYQILKLSDPFNIEKCYGEMKSRAREWVDSLSMEPDKVHVDFTGGTKVMSSALVLVASELNFNTFKYVSGSKRDPSTGRVVSGTGEITSLPNPLIAYAVREIGRANWLINSFHADAAAEILEFAAQECKDELKARIEIYAGISDCLARADRFDFGRGSGYISREFRGHITKLELFDYSLYENLRDFEIRWQNIRDEIRQGNKTPGRETLLELLANAERRAHQSRYDDAAARLYRAVELYGQTLLKQAFRIELGKAKLQDFPERIQQDVKKILGPPEKEGYRIPLQKAYELLSLSDDEKVASQSHIGETLKDHLAKRNDSILAHGARAVSQEDYDKFWDATLQSLNVQDSDIPRWPRINFTV